MRARLAIFVLLGSLGGCFKPNLDIGVLYCTTTNLCPSGYQCAPLPDGRKKCIAMGTSIDASCGNDDLTGTGGAGALVIPANAIAVFDTSSDNGKITIDGSARSFDSVCAFRIKQQSMGEMDVSKRDVAVWNFTDFTLSQGAKLIVIASDWTNKRVLEIAATGTMTIDGSIDITGGGAREGGQGGGQGGEVSKSSMRAGSGQGIGGGAGGAPNPDAGVYGGGGGGNYGGGAQNGVGSGGEGVAGQTYGNTMLEPAYFGSGGGGGSSGSPGAPGRGGPGGGAIALLADKLILNGTIDASGARGCNGKGSEEAGTEPAYCENLVYAAQASGGGGGSGGSIFISANHWVSVGSFARLSAEGGAGGTGVANSGAGGAGGVGRIVIAGCGTNCPTGIAQPNPLPVNSAVVFPK